MIGYEVLRGRKIYSVLFGELEELRVIDVVHCKGGQDILIVEAYRNQWTISDFSSGIGKIYFLSMSSALPTMQKLNGLK